MITQDKHIYNLRMDEGIKLQQKMRELQYKNKRNNKAYEELTIKEHDKCCLKCSNIDLKENQRFCICNKFKDNVDTIFGTCPNFELSKNDN